MTLAEIIDAFEADYSGFHLEPSHMSEWFKKMRAAAAVPELPTRTYTDPDGTTEQVTPMTFTADEMRAYALAAIDAQRLGREKENSNG